MRNTHNGPWKGQVAEAPRCEPEQENGLPDGEVETWDVGEEYPGFAFLERDGDGDFVAVVKRAVEAFDYAELEPYQQTYFKWVKMGGAKKARHHFMQAQAQAVLEQPTHPYARLTDLELDTVVGHQVLSKIPEAERRRFLPTNDVEFLPYHSWILVRFQSLLKLRTPTGTTYYSRHEPQVTFQGRPYTVGFSKHAIEQTCERINQHWMSYAGLGDVFAYFDQCAHFEPCVLRDGSPAFTFYDEIGDERFWQFLYVKRVLRKDGIDPELGPAYFRVGYCPVVFEGRFAKAKTLLFPGFTKTPEYASLQRSRLRWAEKRRIVDVACNSNMSHLQRTDDFSAIKWFHDNGTPQVIQRRERLFVR